MIHLTMGAEVAVQSPALSEAPPSPAAEPRWPSGRGEVVLFGAVVLCSAMLLFAVEPLFAKLVLPRLGSTPAVWNTAIVFYQAVLLGGMVLGGSGADLSDLSSPPGWVWAGPMPGAQPWTDDFSDLISIIRWR
jgi:hypothetical protein